MTVTDVDALLADTTPWVLADIVRELEISPHDAREGAWKALIGRPEDDKAFPAPLPGAPRLRYMDLHLAALGNYLGPEPQWAAGEIRAWAWRCGRLDHNLKIIPRVPPQFRRQRHANRTGWSS